MARYCFTVSRGISHKVFFYTSELKNRQKKLKKIIFLMRASTVKLLQQGPKL